MLIKSQLISEISKRFPHLAEKDLAIAVNAVIEQLSQALTSGGRIEIRGFGSFSLHFRPPRRAHNPKTGSKLITNPKYAAHFKPGKELRDQVNANKHWPIEAMDNSDVDE